MATHWKISNTFQNCIFVQKMIFCTIYHLMHYLHDIDLTLFLNDKKCRKQKVGCHVLECHKIWSNLNRILGFGPVWFLIMSFLCDLIYGEIKNKQFMVWLLCINCFQIIRYASFQFSVMFIYHFSKPVRPVLINLSQTKYDSFVFSFMFEDIAKYPSLYCLLKWNLWLYECLIDLEKRLAN